MANILMTWELGGGLGHLMPMRGVGEELARRGHHVIAAVRDLSRVRSSFINSGIDYLPAPIIARRGKPPFEKTAGFCHILSNVGFSDDSALRTLFSAWNTLYRVVQPDLVITDHSPTALLAMRGKPIRRVNMGLAFYCPPDMFPLPSWEKGLWADRMMKLAEDERELTHKVNTMLGEFRRPALGRLGEIFSDVQETILATYREFDHFPDRPASRYWGHWHAGMGAPPKWPQGKGPKVFAYLKPSAALESLLGELKEAGVPTIVFSAEIPEPLQQRFAGDTLRFERQPLNIERVGAECDLAILNAGHGTTASMLRAGKPCLLMPLYTEQLLNAQSVERMGAGRWCSSQKGSEVPPVLQDMLNSKKYREGAKAFAGRYADLIPERQIAEVAERLEQILREPVRL